MNLPKEIEAEIAKGPRNRTLPATVDNMTDYTPETVEAFTRRIARMVAADCAWLCDDDFEQKAIHQRYGLDENGSS